MAHPVVHFEIAGVDGERSVAFYRDAFGWEIQGAACNAEEGGISGGVMQTRDDIPCYVVTYPSTDDREGSLRRAGSWVARPSCCLWRSLGFGFFSISRDPSGNIIGLWRE